MKLELYDIKWKERFAGEKASLMIILGDEAIDIEHIGSTAIPGIHSKPIIDIAVLIRSFKIAKDFIPALRKAGYKYSEKRSSFERYFFSKGDPAKFHLSLANPDTLYVKRQIAFRDYLNNHPEKAKEYENLKSDLIKKYPSGRDEYSYGKSEFINTILKEVIGC
ncbi:MAG: GrpB family protein [Candidatus Falkowbacteria bacterium]